MGVTITEGANSTPPPGTEVSTTTSDTGEVTNVLFGYLDGTTFTPFGDADGVPITGVTSFEDVGGSATASRSTVNDTNSSTTLIASNALRKGWRIKNTSSATLHIAFGGTASTTNCIASLAQNEFTGDAGIGLYTGDIVGVWATDPNAGVAVITEW